MNGNEKQHHFWTGAVVFQFDPRNVNILLNGPEKNCN
jgi:hypothetical protein